MIIFILNNQLIKTDAPSGMSLLNFIRNEAHLKGTKSGCKEGDCGACTVLEGTLKEHRVAYKTIVSCLTPLGNAHGKHIVTLEGLNTKELTPVQKAITDHAATQCGFCTPGFVVSLTGFSLSNRPPQPANILASVAGNICRCTGYKSIEKAALSLTNILRDRNDQEPLNWLIEKGFIRSYFKTIPGRLKQIPSLTENRSQPDLVVGGGTDLMVQKPETVKVSALKLTLHDTTLHTIREENNKLILGGAVTVNDLLHSTLFCNIFPKAEQWFKLISSEQIRNTATLAGNLVNASPIGDMSIFLLAMNAVVHLSAPSGEKRTFPLKEFFTGYKQLSKHDDEIITAIVLDKPDENVKMNFEKVSKRIHLDIASVNSAVSVRVQNNTIQHLYLTAGGIGPVPMLLTETSAFLTGKPLSAETLEQGVKVMLDETSPISDIRGSTRYKKLLLRQLFYAHFLKLFPETLKFEELLTVS